MSETTETPKTFKKIRTPIKITEYITLGYSVLLTNWLHSSARFKFLSVLAVHMSSYSINFLVTCARVTYI